MNKKMTQLIISGAALASLGVVAVSAHAATNLNVVDSMPTGQQFKPGSTLHLNAIGIVDNINGKSSASNIRTLKSDKADWWINVWFAPSGNPSWAKAYAPDGTVYPTYFDLKFQSDGSSVKLPNVPGTVYITGVPAHDNVTFTSKTGKFFVEEGTVQAHSIGTPFEFDDAHGTVIGTPAQIKAKGLNIAVTGKYADIYNSPYATGVYALVGDAAVTTNITKDPLGTVYRLYNPHTGEHFYTESLTEKNSLVAGGWGYEGIGWQAPTQGTPVYRLYNPNAKGGDHYYTKSTFEVSQLVKQGWKKDNAGKPVFYSGGNTKVYVAYNPHAKSGAHNYTTSNAEQQNLLKAGWKYSTVAWNAVSAK